MPSGSNVLYGKKLQSMITEKRAFSSARNEHELSLKMQMLSNLRAFALALLSGGERKQVDFDDIKL